MRRTLDEWYADARDAEEDAHTCTGCGEYVHEVRYLDDDKRCEDCGPLVEPEACGWCGETKPCGHDDCAQLDAEMAEVACG